MSSSIGNITGALPSLTEAIGQGATKIGGGDEGTEATTGTGGFSDVLRSKLGQLNEMQGVGDQAAQDLATGRVDDVAQAMLSMERANVALQLTTTIRNKAVEAYQEVLRMQI